MWLRVFGAALFLLIADVSLACEGNTSTSTSATTATGIAALVKVELEAPSSVKSGETVRLKLKVENVSGKALTLWAGADHYDFLVTREGEEVWSEFGWGMGLETVCGVIRVVPDVLLSLTFELGEVKEHFEFGGRQPYEALWEQEDNNCSPIPPGTYSVQGIFRASLTDEPEIETVATDPIRLTITR